jgi:hypothetical protein
MTEEIDSIKEKRKKSEELKKFQKFINEWEKIQKFLGEIGDVFEEAKEKKDFEKQKEIIEIIYIFSELKREENPFLHKGAWKGADKYYKKQVRRLIANKISFDEEILNWAFPIFKDKKI